MHVFPRNFNKEFLVIDHGEGIYLYDKKGTDIWTAVPEQYLQISDMEIKKWLPLFTNRYARRLSLTVPSGKPK
jgi:hypothetical protein